jgi:dTDP-D-glucose 4,6-dehydratase
MTNKVLITGGLGFIFSHVTEYFVSLGWEVVVIDDLSEGSHKEIVNGSFVFYEEDCADTKVQDIILKEAPDYIVHTAAISDVDRSIKDPEYVLKQNIMATVNVFEAARFLPNLKKLLYVSTDEVYGECEEKKTEDGIIFPKNPYSVSKALGSLTRTAYDSTYVYLKDKTCEIRMCNIFGPRQDIRKVLPNIKASLSMGRVIPVQNGGVGFREYLYVKNIPPIIKLVLEKGDRVYNVTTNDGYTVNELIKKCEKVTGKKATTKESHRPGMDLKYQMDNTRIMELGWKPLYSLEEGLKDYLC